jgi:hypothetical protein
MLALNALFLENLMINVNQYLEYLLVAYASLTIFIFLGCFLYAKFAAGKEEWDSIMEEVDTRAMYFGKSLLLHKAERTKLHKGQTKLRKSKRMKPNIKRK